MNVPTWLPEQIKNAKSVLVTSHIVPDGDAIGSVLGLGLTIIGMGKRTYMMVEGGVPRNLTFLPGSHLIASGPEGIPDGLDLAVILDVGSYERIGSAERPARSAKAKVNVDHHMTNSGFTEMCWIDTSSPATGLMVADLVKALGAKFGPDNATALFCAISTDTGSFRYSNTTAGCFRTAADLIEAGADPYYVSMSVYDSKPYGAVKGLGEALSALELRSDGMLAVMDITRDLMQRYELTEGDVEGFISYGRSIEGVEVCVAFKELEDGVVKVGFRSKSAVDVSKIAASMGGGGHMRASGCTIEGGLEEARRRVLAVVEAAIAEACGDGRHNRDR
ncbi:MAG TPA: bifunctional oligoribonuclease/PAP phosphatase NrnA [Bacillota bacterium]|nr:bifunctional oligoribonuclease/PAP phosphatase NrnA [Bacillota bacterium]